MKLLLTAFEPFGGESINPALEAVNLVPARINDIEIVKIKVPTVFGKSISVVTESIKREQPDAVLCIGQAGGRFGLTPERVAININDAVITDNEHNQPIDLPIYKDGAPAYFSTLPIKAMVQNIREAGIPASVSNTAGTYVCNHLMYGVLHFLSSNQSNIRAGFMHVPFVTSQVVNRTIQAPSLSSKEIALGIEAAIIAINDNNYDLASAEGSIH